MGTGPEAPHGSSTPRRRMGLSNPTHTRTANFVSKPAAIIQYNERVVKGRRGRGEGRHTLFRAIESDKELLHAIVHEADFVVGHQPNRFRGPVSYQEKSK
jgi:hypothetical protein